MYGMKLLLLIFILPFSLASQTWEQLSDLPASERDDGVAFTIGNTAYYGTGMDGGFQLTRDFYAFDQSTETWLPIASLPQGEERQYACAFTHAGKGYVFGGINAQGTYLNDLWRYSPQSDSWTELFGLPEPGRSGMTCFTLADTVYVVGGKDQAGQELDEVWAYVISSNGWLPKANLPVAMWRGMGFSYNGKGYAGLGANSNGLIPSVYRYLPGTDSWEIVTGINPTPRAYPQIALISNQLYIFAGQDDSGFLASFERVDLSTWNTLFLSAFPSAPRRGGASFAFGTDFYTVGGVTSSARQKETWVARGALALDELNSPGEDIALVRNEDWLFVDSENWTELIIYDALGQEMARSKGVPLNVQDFSDGIYFYTLQCPGKYYAGKWACIHP